MVQIYEVVMFEHDHLISSSGDNYFVPLSPLLLLLLLWIALFQKKTGVCFVGRKEEKRPTTPFAIL